MGCNTMDQVWLQMRLEFGARQLLRLQVQMVLSMIPFGCPCDRVL